MFVPWNLLASYCTKGVALENESLCLSIYMCISSDLTVYKKDGKWICHRPQSGQDLSEIVRTSKHWEGIFSGSRWIMYIFNFKALIYKTNAACLDNVVKISRHGQMLPSTVNRLLYMFPTEKWLRISGLTNGMLKNGFRQKLLHFLPRPILWIYSLSLMILEPESV